MTKTQYKNQNRENRIAERRANKAANRLAGWQAWAAGMKLLRSILLEESDKLQALAVADWRMDRITPKNWRA